MLAVTAESLGWGESCQSSVSYSVLLLSIGGSGGTGLGCTHGFTFMKGLKFNLVRFSPSEGIYTEAEVYGGLNKTHYKTLNHYKTLLSARHDDSNTYINLIFIHIFNMQKAYICYM